MTNYDDLKKIKDLSRRSDTNSRVELLQEENTENFFVRKIIYGIDQPLYQAIFAREVGALYKLNTCSNIVQMYSNTHMQVRSTGEKVGCIYLEYILGETLSNLPLEKLTSKDKFNIIKQIMTAIEVAHSNGIIHRDINPKNIMVTEDNTVKVIDFGICKIKEMVNESTVYQMATNRYSAPEVHLHSENATEQSDLYSIGAVIYFLFTGKEPPIADEFLDVIDKTSGMDVELKPILKKLVAENPEERYNDIYSLKVDCIPLFNRFLNINQQINIVLDSENFARLKNKNIIPRSTTYANTKCISDNFSELYAFKTSDNNYEFLGINYKFICHYDLTNNVFYITKVEKVVSLEREQCKKRFVELYAKVHMIQPTLIHRQSKNDNLEISNIVDNHYQEFVSKKNVDLEYKNKYGAWRELLNLTKQSIENNIVRIPYESYSIKENVISFVLSDGVFLPEESLSKEKMFVYEKLRKGKKTPLIITIGYYEDDCFENNHVVLQVRYDNTRPSLSAKGILCLDYRKDLMNVQRQLDALDTIEKENYSCAFPLKSVISGVEAPKQRVLQGNVSFYNEKLDMSQQAAVRKALSSDSLCIIQGPPGTGKTNVVIEIIRQILKENRINPEIPDKKILLVSQSHPAVDKMLDDLIEQTDGRLSLIRIGRDEKLNTQIRETYGLTCVKEEWGKHVQTKCLEEANRLCVEAEIDKERFDCYFIEREKQETLNWEKDDIDQKFINDFIQETSTVKKERTRKILEIQRQWIEQLNHCEEVDLYIIKSTTIIAGTCIGFISNRVIRDVEFDYLIIDEAAKATFPELAVSFNKAGKIIMVGDHKQLPPVLDNDLIKDNEQTLGVNSLSEGIFEKLYDSFPETNKHRLTVQYRMHPTIGTLISRVFYDNDIQNGIGKEDRKTGIPDYENTAIEWISTSQKSDKQRFEKRVGTHPNYTYKNDLELHIIKDKLRELDGALKKKTKVAVITAYSAQKYALSNMVKQQRFSNLQIDVDTVDAFQGSQKEIIIYSTVRSSKHPNRIGFLKSEARLNVAFSRAQALLIIVGDHKFLNNSNIKNNKFPEIIDYIIENDECRIKEV